jgi:hypothetical protein
MFQSGMGGGLVDTVAVARSPPYAYPKSLDDHLGLVSISHPNGREIAGRIANLVLPNPKSTPDNRALSGW